MPVTLKTLERPTLTDQRQHPKIVKSSSELQAAFCAIWAPNVVLITTDIPSQVSLEMAAQFQESMPTSVPIGGIIVKTVVDDVDYDYGLFLGGEASYRGLQRRHDASQ